MLLVPLFGDPRLSKRRRRNLLKKDAAIKYAEQRTVPQNPPGDYSHFKAMEAAFKSRRKTR